MRLVRRVSRTATVSGAVLVWLWSTVGAAAQSLAAPAVLPSGTSVAVRTIDRITSEGAASALEYKATVDDSVVVNGVTVAPVGTPAFLRVVQVQQAGAVRGRAAVTLRLVAMEINGLRTEFPTGDAKIEGGSQAGKATKSGVAGAVVGGLLGALLGGKKGAAQGAAAGAAIGVTAAIVSGQKIRIPPETRLSFTLIGSSTNSVGGPANAEMLAQLIAIEERAAAAAIAGNRTDIDGMLDPAFSGTFDGKAVSRAQFLKRVKPQPSFVNSELESPELRFDGEHAALTGYYVYRVRQKRDVKAIRQKFRDVFVQSDGRWLLLTTEVVTQ